MQTTLPLQQKERIFLLDAIRGIALCGILILNIGFFARAFQADFDIRIFNETSTADIATWITTTFVLGGSFRALFSMLFGAGAILILSRLEKQSNIGAADIYYRRLIWLLLFGLVNAYVLLWPGDILYHYAICGLFLYPLRNSSPRLLICLALFFVGVTMFKSYLGEREFVTKKEKGVAALELEKQKKTLTEQQADDLKAWQGELDDAKIENIRKKANKETEKMQQPSYADVWVHLKTVNGKMESSIFYNNIFFDVMVCILLGMALFKMGWLTGEKSTMFYVVLLVAGYGLGIGEGLLSGITWYNANMSYEKFIEVWPLPFSLYQAHRVLVAFGHIGLIVLLYRSGVVSGILRLYANVGQMAFTNYLMQSVICTLIFHGYGLGYFGKFARHELWYFVVGVWVFQIIFSAIWLKFFLFGPLEWVWKSLTYWKRQPMSRMRAVELALT